MKTPTKITKISEEPKIFLERFWDNNIPKFSGYYIEMPRELVNESIGTEIWLDGYESGLFSNRPLDKVVMGNDPENQAGYREGMSIWYYENGNINKKMMHKEGIPNGLVEIFWENGKIREKGNNGGPPEPGYSVGNGRRVGLWEIFDEEGNKIEERWFSDKWDENRQPIN